MTNLIHFSLHSLKININTDVLNNVRVCTINGKCLQQLIY